ACGARTAISFCANSRQRLARSRSASVSEKSTWGILLDRPVQRPGHRRQRSGVSHPGRTIPRVPVRVVASPYGRAAAEALRGEIARAKTTSPLAPVTVVVPGNSVGVAARRLLASGELGPVSPAGAGVIGVNFLTGYRLAELLAAPRLAASGRRPVSTAVVAAAVRRVLRSDPGPLFASVAAHPATEEALVGAHRELADLDAHALQLLARPSRAASEAVRLHRVTE